MTNKKLLILTIATLEQGDIWQFCLKNDFSGKSVIA